MTHPDSMLLPTVSVYADGVWVADGRDPDTDEPQALDGLTIRWGRSNVVDQPQPSTCSLTLMDRAGGTRFLDLLQLGGRLDVRADAVVTTVPDPDTGTGQVVISAEFEAGIGDSFVQPASAARLTTAAGGTTGKALQVDTLTDQAALVVIPPGPRQPSGGDPTAWDGIPQAISGETWSLTVDVRPPAPFGGYQGWQVELVPVTFTSPWDVPHTQDLRTTATVELGGGWYRLSGTVLPPQGSWVGVAVRFWPIGPAWDDLADDSTPWSLIATNRVLSPAATQSAGFTVHAPTASLAMVAGWAGFAQAARLTRTAAGATRHGICADWPAAGTYAVRLLLRASESIAGVNFQFRPNLASSTGAVTVYTATVAAGQSIVQFSGAAPAPPGGTQLGIAITWNGGTVGQTLDVTGVQMEAGTAVGSYFDGDTADTSTDRYEWTGTVGLSSSTHETGGGGFVWDQAADTITWDSLGRLLLDRVRLNAPAAGTLRQGMVFSGRITDMEARYEDTEQATFVDVTAADQRAELGSRDVGDAPWLEETLGSRFQRIITASGQPIQARVSATASPLMISWRDVDRQPAIVLLSELAASADGVLWAATHPTTGPYLSLESLSDRAALYTLNRGTDLVVRIAPKSLDSVGGVILDACDVLLEPVRWRHDIEDMATQVSVTWREQTLDDKGQPAPTDRTITSTNTVLEQTIGRHRVAVSTQLSRLSSAGLVADAVLGRTGNQQWRVGGLTWRADTTDQLDADALTRMMQLLDGTTRNGLPLMLTNLPAWSPVPGDEAVPLFLEGGTYSSQDGGWVLDLVTSSAKAIGATAAWDEIPGAPVLQRTNRATNPRAVTGGTAQWGQAGWGTGGAGTTSYITGVTAPSGTNIGTAFRKTWTTAATSATAAALALTGDASNRIPVTAGKTYTVSVFVRHNSIGTKTYEILLRWFSQVATSGGAQVGTDQIGAAVSVADGTGWTRLAITVTAPAGALAMLAYPRLQLAATGAIPVGATQDGTGLLIEEAPAPAGAYFDGAADDTASTDYSWTGTAHASTSTQSDLTNSWQWDQFDPSITWNDLGGVAAPTP